MWIVNK